MQFQGMSLEDIEDFYTAMKQVQDRKNEKK